MELRRRKEEKYALAQMRTFLFRNRSLLPGDEEHRVAPAGITRPFQNLNVAAYLRPLRITTSPPRRS